MLLVTHIDVGVVGALHQPLPPFLELPPDDQIEVGEDDEGSHRGEEDPGPGGVPQDVVLAQPQLRGSCVKYLVRIFIAILFDLLSYIPLSWIVLYAY